MQALPSGRARGVLAGIFAVSGLLISPFLAPHLQTRPARSQACRPQAPRQAAAPRRREAPERAPASALGTRARERLWERGARQTVHTERGGRGRREPGNRQRCASNRSGRDQGEGPKETVRPRGVGAAHRKGSGCEETVLLVAAAAAVG